MPSKSESERRKAIVKDIAQREREAAIALMPISGVHLAELFDYLDTALVSGCDHSLSFTRTFIHGHGLSKSAIVAWLGEYGGYCDCEVLANVEEHWGKA
jgi:hypothetical protein